MVVVTVEVVEVVVVVRSSPRSLMQTGDPDTAPQLTIVQAMKMLTAQYLTSVQL